MAAAIIMDWNDAVAALPAPQEPETPASLPLCAQVDQRDIDRANALSCYNPSAACMSSNTKSASPITWRSQDVPTVIEWHICSFLPPHDLIRLQCASRAFGKLVPSYWRNAVVAFVPHADSREAAGSSGVERLCGWQLMLQHAQSLRHLVCRDELVASPWTSVRDDEDVAVVAVSMTETLLRELIGRNQATLQRIELAPLLRTTDMLNAIMQCQQLQVRCFHPSGSSLSWCCDLCV